jgi:hypothetical protein
VAAILALRSNPALTAAMGHRARQLAMRFDRRVAVEAYHDLFTQLPPNTDPTREGVHLAASANAMASRAEALRRSEEARGRDADATTEPA